MKGLARAGLLVSAIGAFYSGLMFLAVVPAPLSIRFWDGGPAAMATAAVLDIACGSVLFYLATQVLLGTEVRRHARHALIVCLLAVVSDWIGGLYGISAPDRCPLQLLADQGAALADLVTNCPTGRREASGMTPICPPGGAHRTSTPLNSPPW